MTYILFYCVLAMSCEQVTEVEEKKLSPNRTRLVKHNVTKCKTEKTCPTERFGTHDACWARLKEVMNIHGSKGSGRYIIYNCEIEDDK